MYYARKLLMILALGSIGGGFAINALAFDTSNPIRNCSNFRTAACSSTCPLTYGPTVTERSNTCDSSSSTLNLFDGSIVRCKLTPANSVIEGDLPNATVIIKQIEGQTIPCSKIFTDGSGDVWSGEADLAEDIVATQVMADGCTSDNQAGTSELRYHSLCGTGADITGMIQWTSGPETHLYLQNKTFAIGGSATLSTRDCNILFDSEGEYKKRELFRAILTYDQTKCKGHAGHGSPVDFRTCTAQDLDFASSCYDSMNELASDHVSTVTVEQYKAVGADVRNKINETGCPSNGQVDVYLNGADVDVISIDPSSLYCGNPDHLFISPAIDVKFNDTQPFSDGIPDAIVSCFRCDDGMSLLTDEGLLSVVGNTLENENDQFVGIAQATETALSAE